MSPKVSSRGRLPGFEVMHILDQVAELRHQGIEVISLCAGEPAQGAPTPVRRRAADMQSDGTDLGYGATLGSPALRAGLVEHYQRRYDLQVSPVDVTIHTGASGALTTCFLAAFDPGDRVALARPGYPAYRNMLTAVGCEVVEIPCGPRERFQPSLDAIRATHADAPLAGLLVASPANPTGTMYTTEEFAAIAQWCQEAGVRLISDEIYHGITFDGRFGDCAWTYNRDAVVISSFSKLFGMTGWRLGWALVPPDLRPSVHGLTSNLALCAPTTAQEAALAAFTDESLAEADAAVRAFAEARDVVLSRLGRLGWSSVAPADGAFYFWAEPPLGPHADTRAWCAALLDEQRVAVTPGIDFDDVEGRRFIRISLAAGAEAVGRALDRIEEFQSGF